MRRTRAALFPACLLAAVLAAAAPPPAGAGDEARPHLEAGRLSGTIRLDGRLDTLEVEGVWNPHPLFTLTFSGERNWARLEEGNFTEDVYGSKLRVNFSFDLTVSAFTQYASEDRSLGTNIRLHWIATPASNLYLVYTQNWAHQAGAWRNQSFETQVKLQYTFRF